MLCCVGFSSDYLLIKIIFRNFDIITHADITMDGCIWEMFNYMNFW